MPSINSYIDFLLKLNKQSISTPFFKDQVIELILSLNLPEHILQEVASLAMQQVRPWLEVLFYYALELRLQQGTLAENTPLAVALEGKPKILPRQMFAWLARF